MRHLESGGGGGEVVALRFLRFDSSLKIKFSGNFGLLPQLRNCQMGWAGIVDERFNIWAIGGKVLINFLYRLCDWNVSALVNP